MNGQEDGGAEKGQANDNPPPKPESTKADQVRPVGIQSGGGDHQKRPGREVSNEEPDLADRIKRSDRWMISLTAAIVFLTVVNVLIFYRESEGSARDIREFAGKAGEMVIAVNKSLSADREAIKVILGDNRSALAALEGQINSSLKANVEAARTDQEAQLGVLEGTPSRPITVGARLSFTFRVANTGRSRALHVRQMMRYGGLVKGEPLNAAVALAASGPFRGQGEILPGGSFTLGDTIAEPLSQVQVDGLISGSSSFYVYGIIRYSDIFRRAHVVRYCFRLLISGRGFSQAEPGFTHCDEYNDSY